MKQVVLGFLFLCVFSINAQTTSEDDNKDDKYLEDQFYLGITYNFLINKPTDVTQRNLSYGLHGGIIKDLPLNSDRTFALGVGLGYAVNSYYTSMLATDSNIGIIYAKDDGILGVKRSKIENHLVEMPIELRWRNSSPEEFKFWRVYTGLKLGYIFSARSKLVTESDKTSFNNSDILRFQYGLMFNFGYNTFNIHIYYSLSNLFNDGVLLESEEITMKPLRVGLIFYIL
ncbi:MAG: porin family protein [Maribacter sp.]